MSTEKQYTYTSVQKDNEFDLAKYLSVYIKKWKWFVFSCFIFVGLAFFHLRYTTPEYNAYAKILLFDNENASTPASVLLKDSNFSANESKRVEDEIDVFKSRELMEGVVKKLSLNIQYYIKGRVHDSELFPDTPIKLNFFSSDSIVDRANYSFYIKITSDTTFDFIEKDDEDNVKTEKKVSFGENIDTPVGKIVIIPNNENILDYMGQTILVKMKPVEKLAASYSSKIIISQKEEFSKIVQFSLNDPVKEKAKQIINTLISEYIEKSMDEKNRKSKNTAEFINNRISLISNDLSDVDNEIQEFKTGNRLTDISSEAELYLNSSSQTEQELVNTQTQLNLIEYMKSYVSSNDSNSETIPSNLGLSDSGINDLAQKYNEILGNRNNLLKGSTKSKNPIIVNLDYQLDGLKERLKQSLNNSSKTLSVKISDLENQSSKLNSKIYSIPGQVRKSRDIERQQGTKESIYLYLLQKREEANISLTSNSSNVKVIDQAYASSEEPVSPNRLIVFLASIITGLCIPFAIIYIGDLLDNKIHNKEDLEKEINDITVLGEIPRIKAKKTDNVIARNDRSILSESFRIIRTNFDYVSKSRNVADYNNVIFVASTINGEGKSFFSMNMALTLANTDKRVLLIGADIRNPKTHPSLKNAVSKIGLTEYLVDKSILVGEGIDTYEVNGNTIDVMLSGKIPPNPAELLMSDRMKTLFDKVSAQYDYVIVDTAPAMLVTDTLLFSQYAGHTIYMTRAGYTEKRILNFAKELHANNKLKGMMLVVNDVEQSNFGYGARYGYGTAKKKYWFSRNKA